MWNGPQALRNIDRTLQSVRDEVVRLDARLSQLTERMASQQRHRVRIIKDIAAVRLAEIERGGLADSLDLADQEAVQILQSREQALAELNERIETLNQAVVTKEQQREGLLQQVNESSQSIVELEASVQKRLGEDDGYLAQLERSRLAESVATEAAQKVASAQADMASKAEPYQNDALFSYLWGRGYGTTEYRAGFITRFLDGWVARLIDFEPARLNYWNLTEIPKRLQQHANGVAQQADEMLMALQQFELDALANVGVPQHEDALEQLRERIDQHDDALAADETQLNEKLAERAMFVTGDDRYIGRCLTVLAAAMEQQNLRAVHRYVQVTHSPTDDQLLLELRELDSHSAAVKDDLADVRQLHHNQLDRLQEIEEVRRSFKNSRFDDVRSGFDKESLLASVLAQFVQGVVSGSEVWRVIKRSQRYRDVGSLPDFGSGGFGQLGDVLGGGSLGRARRPRNSSWHWPKPRRGGGGFNLPSGGGRSNDGFRTGGGF